MRVLSKKIILSLIAILSFVFSANAQLEFPEDKVSWEFTIEQNGCDATIVGKITCVEHWHIYAAKLPAESFLIATEIEPEKSKNYKVIGKVIEPKPEFYHDEAADEDIYQHSGTITMKRKIKILSEKDFTLKGRFSFQTCDESHCLPPYDAEFTLKVKGCGDDNVEVVEEKEELNFDNVDGDETKDNDGNTFVKVNEKWFKVPEGNSTNFYKEYLKLGGSHEE